MYVTVAHSKQWNDIVLQDSFSDEKSGSLIFRYTDIAGVLFFGPKEELDSLDDVEYSEYESNPLIDPFYYIKDNIILIDLLYYRDFSLMKDPPRINFADLTKEYGISLTFKSIDEVNDFMYFLKTYLTLELPHLPGFYRITRFHPPFSSEILKRMPNKFDKQKKKTDANDSALLNILIAYQHSLTPHFKFMKPNRPFCDDNVKLNTIADITNALNDFTIPKNRLFSTWLKLLYLPQINQFKGKYIEQYLNVKQQWKDITISQLLRSEAYKEHFHNVECSVNKHYENLPISKHNIILTRNLVFNVLMSICQIDNNLFDYIDCITNMLNIILQTTQFIFVEDEKQQNDDISNCTFNIIIDNNKIDNVHFEAILFWILLKILFRGELFRIYPLYSQSPKFIFESVSFFIYRTCPFFYYLLEEYNFWDSNEPIPYILDLFCSFFDYDQVIELWTVAMCSRSIFEFFLSFLICCLSFNAQSLLYEDRNKQIQWLQLIKNPIDEFGLRFMISSAIQLTNNLRDFTVKF